MNVFTTFPRTFDVSACVFPFFWGTSPPYEKNILDQYLSVKVLVDKITDLDRDKGAP